MTRTTGDAATMSLDIKTKPSKVKMGGIGEAKEATEKKGEQAKVDGKANGKVSRKTVAVVADAAAATGRTKKGQATSEGPSSKVAGLKQSSQKPKNRVGGRSKVSKMDEETRQLWEEVWEGGVHGHENMQPEGRVSARQISNALEKQASASSSSRLPNGRKRPRPDGSEGVGRELWEMQLQELRRKTPRGADTVVEGSNQAPATEAELVAMLKSALATGNWSTVIGRSLATTQPNACAAVKQLSHEHCLRILQAVLKPEYFMGPPKIRDSVTMWLNLIVEYRAEALLPRKEFVEALRHALDSLANRLGASRVSYQARAVKGKWGILSSLVRIRLDHPRTSLALDADLQGNVNGAKDEAEEAGEDIEDADDDEDDEE
mmetsp:Transcript_69186/g.165895  ORF Transcript_69186/g.165895 Transcript_69186/m.165895 type:complete len:376 (+) Transcript_69186:145-1272(+)